MYVRECACVYVYFCLYIYMHYIYIYMYALLLMHAFLSEKLLPDGKISGKSDIIHRQTGENIYIYIRYYIILYYIVV